MKTGHLPSTGERMVPDGLSSAEDYILYLRQLFAYHVAQERLPSEARVLDVGVGEGYGSRLLAASGRWVVGVDVDPDTVFHASRRTAPGGASFALSGGCELPFPAGSFDAIVSFQVIEHIKDDRGFVGELARVLRPGGIALLTTPNRALRLAPGQRPWNRFHQREYAQEDLRSLLSGAFSAVDVLGVDASPDVRRLEEARLRRIRRLVALDPLELRRRLPTHLATGLRSLMYRILRRRNEGGEMPDWSARYALSDFFLAETSPETGLDLLAICRSPKPQVRR
jgi:2-polyprenyl-3-methyl-5-hydroxy-6-metoxy-1,4-benzoquinol methylase